MPSRQSLPSKKLTRGVTNRDTPRPASGMSNLVQFRKPGGFARRTDLPRTKAESGLMVSRLLWRSCASVFGCCVLCVLSGRKLGRTEARTSVGPFGALTGKVSVRFYFSKGRLAIPANKGLGRGLAASRLFLSQADQIWRRINQEDSHNLFRLPMQK